jgi:hypothetical protein
MDPIVLLLSAEPLGQLVGINAVHLSALRFKTKNLRRKTEGRKADML